MQALGGAQIVRENDFDLEFDVEYLLHINLFTYKDMKMIKPEHSSSNTFSKAGHSFAMILARLTVY